MKMCGAGTQKKAGMAVQTVRIWCVRPKHLATQMDAANAGNGNAESDVFC